MPHHELSLTFKNLEEFLSKSAESREIAQELIDWLLNNPEEFDRLVDHTVRLFDLVYKFPNKHKELIARMISNPNTMYRLINDYRDLRIIGNQLSEYKGDLITAVMQDIDLLNKLLNHITPYLPMCRIGEAFPQHHEIIVQTFTQNLDLLNQLLPEPVPYIEFCNLGNTFRNHHDLIMSSLVNNFELFNRVVVYHGDLCMIGTTFPDNKVELIEYLNQHESVFINIIKGYRSFFAIVRVFKEEAYRLLPDIFNNTAKFKALIIAPLDLIKMAELAPDYTSRFMDKVLQEFDFCSFFKTILWLNNTARCFHDYPDYKKIFSQPDMETAKKAADQYVSRLRDKEEQRLLLAASKNNSFIGHKSSNTDINETPDSSYFKGLFQNCLKELPTFRGLSTESSAPNILKDPTDEPRDLEPLQFR